MRIGIIGVGHVGLVTAACLAHLKHDVLGADRDRPIIGRLQKGEVSFYEPGLPELVAQGLKQGRLQFTTSIQDVVEQSHVVFICVNTPTKENGVVDLSAVEAVASEIGKHLRDYRVIVERSTVPAKTGERIARTLRRLSGDRVGFDVVSFPEFSREGTGVQDFLHPDRLVIGVDSPRAETIMRDLVRPLEAPLVLCNVKTAELIKHASNCFLATKISYINAIADICERVGADVTLVAEGMGFDRRISRPFLDAGLGYGGSCFPKDVSAFITLAAEAGYEFSLLKEVKAINEERKSRIVAKLRHALWVLDKKKIAVLGLSFKPNTDDMRNAPSIGVVELLLGEGATVSVYDPVAMPNARGLLGDRVTYASDAYEAAGGADAVALLTEWEQFGRLDMARLKQALSLPIIVDARNFLDSASLKKIGFEYYGVGR